MAEAQLPTSVDLEQLNGAVDWLKQLQGFIETHCIGHLPEVSKHLNTAGMSMDGVDKQLNGQPSVFGAFYSGYGLQAKHDSTFRAVGASLRAMAAHLGQTADATVKIIEKYRTVEEQNSANVQDIQRALAAGTYTAVDPQAVAGGQPPAQEPAARRDDVTVLAPGPLDGPRGTTTAPGPGQII